MLFFSSSFFHCCMEVQNSIYNQLPAYSQIHNISRECGPWGAQADWFLTWEITQKPTCASYIPGDSHCSFLSALVKKWISSVIIISRKFTSFRKLSRKFGLRIISLWTGVPNRVVEEGKIWGRLQRLWLLSRNDALPDIWVESSQSSNSLSLQQWVEKKNKKTFEWYLRSFFRSILSLLVLQWMNPLQKLTSSEPGWNFETKFLPVLGKLEVVGHEFYYAPPLGSVGTQNLSGNWFKAGVGGGGGGGDCRTRKGRPPHVALISNSC